MGSQEIDFQKVIDRYLEEKIGRGLNVLTDIVYERGSQDEKWGEQWHTINIWMSILGEEYGEVCQEALRLTFDTREGKREEHMANLREELVQVAAVATAIVEYIDQGKIRPEPLDMEVNLMNPEDI